MTLTGTEVAGDGLDAILSPINRELDAVETLLSQWAAEAPAPVAEPMAHTLSAGGKRVRPALVLLSAKLGEDKTLIEQAYVLAAASEILHTASLIHDDVVDEARIRRGVPAVREQWNSRRALLVGDYWYSWMMNLLARLAEDWPRGLSVVAEVTDTVCLMCQSEAAQQVRGGPMASIGDYLDLASSKTGSLMSACCKLGAWCWDADEKSASRLADYGRELGISFQIADDILDIEANETATGKAQWIDLERNSASLPLILAMERAKGQDAEVLNRALNEEDSDESALARVADVIQSCGALDACRDEASRHAERAVNALSVLPEDPHREALTALASYAISRGR